MKKFISVLLSVIMIFSLVSVGVSAADDGLKITVANDLHYNEQYSNYEGTDYVDADYSHVPSNGQLWIESEKIIDTFLAEIAQNDSEIVLLPGDLADRGKKTEHEYLAAKLTAFEAATGKRIYVVPGNHDYYGGVTVAEFMDFYQELGYGEAIAVDTNSASYVVDLDDEYRLFAIDSCVPKGGEAGIDEERKAWIEEQAKKAQADGKKVISMMHHNLLNHFIFGEVLHPGGFIDSSIELPELYAQYNIKYNFSAHTHAQDIKAYTGKNGVTVYDVLTSSLNLYPVPYRTVTLGEKVEIKTEIIESIDMTSFEGIISENCYKLATEDFQEYAKQCTLYGLNSVTDSYVTPAKIRSLLKLDILEHSRMWVLVDELVPVLKDALEMPLYIKDEVIDTKSLEAIAGQIDLMFPKTEFKNFKELGFFMYMQYVTGDENFGLFSDEFTLMTASLTALLSYVLEDVDNKDYATVLNFLADFIDVEIPVTLMSYAGNAISRIEGIEIFVSAIASTLLLHFTTDEVPTDNNATLPGYDVEIVLEENLTLWQRIVRFFTSIFDYILRIFGVGK